jgi:hypothetical protein
MRIILVLDLKGKTFYGMLAEFEIALIEKALSREGNITRAARFLKLKRTTLTEKMRRFGLKSKNVTLTRKDNPCDLGRAARQSKRCLVRNKKGWE